MNAAEQVQYETRVRMRYAVIAFFAALLLVGSQLIQLSGPHTHVDELTLDLITVNRRFPIDLIGATVNAIGLLALMTMLIWVHGISRARNPEIRNWIRWLVMVGAGLSAVMAVVYAIVVAIKAHQFVSSGTQSYVEANHLTSSTAFAVLPLLAQLGSLLLTVGFIWVALNGLRVGLLTRPVGYAGVLAGALVLFPIGAFVPFVQGFWLVAMSVLFAGRWPNGTPPAWEQGIAVPWLQVGQPRGQAAPVRTRPTRERRTRLSDLMGSSSKRDEQAPAPAPTALAAADGDDAARARTRANTSKRKRKHRG